MARLSNERITRCVLEALEEAGGFALGTDWRSLPDDQRVSAPLDVSRLSERGKDALIQAIRTHLRSHGAYCHLQAPDLGNSRSVRDLIGFLHSHHQPIP